MRLAVGGPVTDEAGQVWGQDRGFVGGRIGRTTAPIAGASADALFQTERYDLDGYHIPVPTKGRYEVTLRLAETHFDAAGKRVFDVTAEGRAKATGVDIFALAGGKNRATAVRFETYVGDGMLNLGFVDRVNYAKVNAIRVRPVTASATPSPSVSGPVKTRRAFIAMSTERSQWDSALQATGSVDSRRLFGQLDSPAGVVELARQESAAGRYAILSFKVPGDDWSGAAAGKYDASCARSRRSWQKSPDASA